MTPTSIQFIDGLRQEWSRGAVSRDAALERLLLWEDDPASRTQEELEAAWTLRQEIDSGMNGLSQEAETSLPSEASPADTTQVEQVAHEQDTGAAVLEQMLADLRANPLVSRDDLVAAHALCARLATSGPTPNDDKYIRKRCSEVSKKVDLHIEAVQQLVEEATQALHDSPDIEEKLHACDRIREALTDIEMLHPSDASLPDMITWCEQTGHELRTLLAGRDLLLADVADICASEEIDVGLIESSKQRLIVMSDTPLAKDDVSLRRAARDLTARLNTYLSSKLQPGMAGIALGEEALEGYERVLRLAKQAPEAIGADEAKTYSELLAAAQAERAITKQGSEPPGRSIPTVPPPQPRSTTGSQPNPNVPLDTGSQLPLVAQNQPAQPTPTSGSTRPLPPPPPPRVYSGIGSGGTQPTQPISQPPVNISQHGQISSIPPPPQPRNTASVSQNLYTQPVPSYSMAPTGQGMPAAAWAGIAIATVAIVVIVIVILIFATSSKGGGDSTPRETVSSYYQNLREHKYQAARNLMAPELANQVSAQDLQASVEGNERAAGPMQPVEVPNVFENGNTAQTTVIIKYADGQFITDIVTLRKEGNRWLITSIN